MAAEVKTIWATPNGDALIGRLARVSNPANQDNPDTSKLIGYLLRNQHWSPFEMVSMCVEINTTRDIGRQVLRHRSFSFQELSQRYQDVGVLGDEPVLRECRLQDTKNRQNSLPSVLPELDETWEQWQRDVWHISSARYKAALANGIAKEQARALLPEGLTPTRMYMAGTLRSWLHYIDLRSDEATQKEHREVALLCRNEVREQFPQVHAAMWPELQQ